MRNIRKVIFVEPRGESPNVYSGILIPRTGAVLLATLLRENGYESKVFCEDIAPVDEDELFSADLIGISALTNTARPAYRLRPSAGSAASRPSWAARTPPSCRTRRWTA